jgi:hypothetical protein
VYETACFDALGFVFRVVADDPRLTWHVGDLFAGLATSRREDHRYAFCVTAGPGAQPWQLTLDGQLMFNAPTAEELVSSLVQHVNRLAVEGCDAVVLHAGGVERDGRGLVFPAAMEAGKTTLSAGLVRAGLAYLTDEAIAIDPRTLLIRPYPKPLSLDPGSWGLFPELEPRADLASDEYKAHRWQIAPAAIGAIGGPAPIAVVAFPHYAPGAETELVPMKRSEALVELAKNTFGFAAAPKRALDVLADVARAAECYQFPIGDLDAAVDAVERVAGAPAAPRAAG